jgi:FkbM family methyltransferase
MVDGFKDKCVLGLARVLVRIRPLRPYPGWYFACAEDEPKLLVRIRLALWKYCNRKQLEKSIQCPWYHDLKIFLYLGNDASRLFFVGGCYEPNEFFFLNRTLKPGMTFVDVGANEGFYSVFAAKLVGELGQVIAIEPDPSMLERLKRNIILNGIQNISIVQCAVSSYSGVENLSIAEYGHEGITALGTCVPNPLVKTRKVIKTVVKPLDEILSERGIKNVHFVKIDAEGSEVHVLRGAEQIIRASRPILQLEINDQALEAQNSSSEELINLLKTWDYQAYRFGESGEITTIGTTTVTNENIIAAEKSEAIIVSP